MEIDRRNFIRAAAMTGSTALTASAQPPKKMIGIQVGAISFLDEGVEQVMDIFQQRAYVNTLFLAVFLWPRHCREAGAGPAAARSRQTGYDLNFHCGNFATPHPQYY